MNHNIPMYARAPISNVLILTKLGHVLRIMPFPKTFFDQVRTRVHRFIYGRLFPKMRSSLFYLPKRNSGLGLLDDALQQQVFHFRYMKAIVNDSTSQYNLVPSFVTFLISDFLETNYAAPSAALPLLFSGWRAPTGEPILSRFLPLIFKAVDACFPARSTIDICPKIPPARACLAIPIQYALPPNAQHDGPAFQYSKHLFAMKVSDFFYFCPQDQLLHFRPETNHPYPRTLRKLQREIRYHMLRAPCYFAFHICFVPLASLPAADVLQARYKINRSSTTVEPFLL
ncbi:hypothetical protein [Parasitella parasitica]|uniref:Uncharacterized protein n=1 Tax=Parasitella parasitica TaxID=35722 RepID=A0A0B7NM72_9FUNG|nr:hypothetical protein [Parasitella parasitica]